VFSKYYFIAAILAAPEGDGHEAEPAHGRADHRDLAGAGSRGEGGRRVPQARNQQRDLLPLRDAGHYVTALPTADQGKTHWQTAAHELMMAAERSGILMLAEIAMRQALANGRPKPAAAPRKKAVKKYNLVR
jgi:hypothetical protein